jgi:hypothetical protein
MVKQPMPSRQFRIFPDHRAGLRWRSVRAALVLALVVCGLVVVTSSAASANALYCNNQSSNWNQCIYNYIDSKGRNHVQAQSVNSNSGPFLGHTEILGTGGGVGNSVVNSPNHEIFPGQVDTATINLGLANSVHTRWCSYFWRHLSNGKLEMYSGICINRRF